MFHNLCIRNVSVRAKRARLFLYFHFQTRRLRTALWHTASSLAFLIFGLMVNKRRNVFHPTLFSRRWSCFAHQPFTSHFLSMIHHFCTYVFFWSLSDIPSSPLTRSWSLHGILSSGGIRVNAAKVMCPVFNYMQFFRSFSTVYVSKTDSHKVRFQKRLVLFQQFKTGPILWRRIFGMTCMYFLQWQRFHFVVASLIPKHQYLFIKEIGNLKQKCFSVREL